MGLMKFDEVVVDSIGHALPEETLSSDGLEAKLGPVYERLGLPPGRLELMTGIRERRLWAPGTTPSEASSRAGEALLRRAPFDRREVDLLIHSAVCRDRLEPATAAYVHRNLGLPDHTQILDVSNACLGFLNALILAAGLIQSGQIRRALIVAGENGRPLLDSTIRKLLADTTITRKSIKPFFANLTIGCGAVAFSLSRRHGETKTGFELRHAVCQTDSSHSQLCEGDFGRDGAGLEMQTDSEALLEAGLDVAAKAWNRFQEAGTTHQRIITHQVGRTHQRRLHQALKIDPSLDFSTYPVLGNVGSVSCPISLSLGEEQAPSRPGHSVALLGIGSGLSSVMMSLRKIG